MAGRRIDTEQGEKALQGWRDLGQDLPRAELLTAVRYTLGILEERIPGRSVEVRVPPAGAVQVLGGTSHRRGTPPAVIEVDMHTWLRMVEGRLAWAVAEEDGLIEASGERADLSPYLPL